MPETRGYFKITIDDESNLADAAEQLMSPVPIWDSGNVCRADVMQEGEEGDKYIIAPFEATDTGTLAKKVKHRITESDPEVNIIATVISYHGYGDSGDADNGLKLDSPAMGGHGGNYWG